MPKRGMRFKHSRVLNAAGQPADYIVTKVANGLVYYKQPGEKKAKEYTSIALFSKVAFATAEESE